MSASEVNKLVGVHSQMHVPGMHSRFQSTLTCWWHSTGGLIHPAEVTRGAVRLLGLFYTVGSSQESKEQPGGVIHNKKRTSAIPGNSSYESFEKSLCSVKSVLFQEKKKLLFGAWNKGALCFLPLPSEERGTGRLNPTSPFGVHPHKLVPALQ